MSVVINDLEVVAPEQAASGPGPARAAEPAAPTPFELRALVRQAQDRADRARAD